MASNLPLANVVLVVTAAVLFYVAVTDLKHYKIGNELILVLIGLFFVHTLFSGRWLNAAWSLGLAASVLIFLLYFYSRRWMGGGDVKILTAAFLWTGVECALAFALLLLVFASLHAIAAKFGWAESQADSDRRARIAFAPSVAAALIAVFMLGCLRPSA
jgi:Flp pilus assembly protein protease CpaA